MKNLIVANWKMNPETAGQAKDLFEAVKKGISDAKVEVVICPPFVYLSESKGITLGAQNVFYQEKGAFTGEISPTMLKDLGVEYVIVGHSEVRKHLGETNEVINKKIKALLKEGLKPILCIGEDEGQEKSAWLEMQLTECLAEVTGPSMENVVVAYEPIWAIGTGNNCSVEETTTSLLFIKKVLSNLYTREIADNAQILYGGSVKAENAASYLKEAGAGGLLVGGASLKPEEFLQIVAAAE